MKIKWSHAKVQPSRFHLNGQTDISLYFVDRLEVNLKLRTTLHVSMIDSAGERTNNSTAKKLLSFLVDPKFCE